MVFAANIRLGIRHPGYYLGKAANPDRFLNYTGQNVIAGLGRPAYRCSHCLVAFTPSNPIK